MKFYTILISFVFSQLFSATITIPNDYVTIQEGINASSNGDTVMVQPGIYYENLYINFKQIYSFNETISVFI